MQLQIDDEKWQFLPNQICYKCKKYLGRVEELNNEVITSCVFCKESFID